MRTAEQDPTLQIPRTTPPQGVRGPAAGGLRGPNAAGGLRGPNAAGGPRRVWPTLAAAVIGAVAVTAIGFTALNDDHRVISTGDARTPVTSVPPPATAKAVDQDGTAQKPPATTKPTSPPATTPRPEPLSDASRLRIDGLGPVSVGMTLAEASAAAGMPIKIENPGQPIGDNCFYARAQGGPKGVGFMVIDGRILRVDVGTLAPDMQPSRIKTLSGVRIGSTEDEVRGTYPGRIRTEPAKYQPGGHDLVYLPESSTSFGLIFETDGSKVTSFRSGYAEQVSWTEGCA